ncbi:MAG TPA: response regulator [Bradyrhizobium sp.]|nr:response regulator [Bradyrhizobium sp.]
MKPVIAVVDDDEAVRHALASLLRSLGYAALVFAGAQELLDSPRRGDVSCLISDVQMPGMTGLELYERLLASEEPIPTILITAYPNEQALSRALNDGVVCYLTKPFADEELLACIRAILDRPVG